MTEEMQKELTTTQRRLLRMIIQTKIKTTISNAAAHLRMSTETFTTNQWILSQRRRKLTTAPKIPTSTTTAAKTLTATFTSVQQDEDTLEDEVDDLMTAHGIKSLMLSQHKCILNQAGMMAKHHNDRWTVLTTQWSPVTSTKQTGHRKRRRQTTRWEDNINPRYDQKQTQRRPDLMNDITWLTAARNKIRDSMESDDTNFEQRETPRPTTVANMPTIHTVQTLLIPGSYHCHPHGLTRFGFGGINLCQDVR